MYAIRSYYDFVEAFNGRLPPLFRLVSGSAPLCQSFAKLYSYRYRTIFQGLLIGVAYYKINIGNALFVHMVYSIAATATYSNNFYY